MAATSPAKLAKLQADIELVSLEVLLERYLDMLKQKFTEGDWQTFFTENPFILSMAIGCPIIQIQGQAFVGGQKLTGAGSKITDF